MLAQASLILAESKKLTAKAVTGMQFLQEALREGLVVLHLSSSTYFIIDAITGRKTPTDV